MSNPETNITRFEPYRIRRQERTHNHLQEEIRLLGESIRQKTADLERTKELHARKIAELMHLGAVAMERVRREDELTESQWLGNE